MDAKACPQIKSPISNGSRYTSGEKTFSPLKSRLSPISCASKKSKKDKENAANLSKRSGRLSLNLKKVEVRRMSKIGSN